MTKVGCMKQEHIEIPDQPEQLMQVEIQFGAPIYSVSRPEFLQPVRGISQQLLDQARNNPDYDSENPLVMTENFFAVPDVKEFSDFVGQTSWEILRDQGYAMDAMDVVFSEMWVQEHNKHSLMEQHTHRFGSQIVGFYFLDVPDPAPMALFYDPRVAAVQGGLPEKDSSTLTLASSIISRKPKPGDFIFTNAWLAHSLSKNISDRPFRFVHFNLFAAPTAGGQLQVGEPAAEVI
jgi:uncharacterized protein (TIGR02466 family)